MRGSRSSLVLVVALTASLARAAEPEAVSEQARALAHGNVSEPVSAAENGPTSEESAWEEHPIAVQLAFAPIGSPSGVLGLNADYAFLSWFSVSTGVGLGGLVYHDPNAKSPTPLIAASARFRMPSDSENAFAVAAGASMGPYAQGTYCVDCAPDGDTVWVWHWAYWADLSLGYELRTHALKFSDAVGLAVQLNLGAEFLLNGQNDECYQSAAAYGGTDHDPCVTNKVIHHIVFPFFQVTGGFAF